MEMNRRLALFLVAVLTALVGTGTAWGKCRHQPKGNPAVQQYVEIVPAVCGPTGKGRHSTTLPTAIANRLGSGPEADLLRKAATSEEYGAPQTVKKLRSDLGAKDTGRNPIAASFGAVTGGSNGRLIEVLALMVAIAALGVGAIAYRPSRRRIDR